MSVAPDGIEASAESVDPAISDDGRYVAFYSFAGTIVAGDANGVADVFLHDIASATSLTIKARKNVKKGREVPITGTLSSSDLACEAGKTVELFAGEKRKERT